MIEIGKKSTNSSVTDFSAKPSFRCIVLSCFLINIWYFLVKNLKAVWNFQWSLGVWFGPYCLPILPPAPATVPLVDESLHALRRICCPTDSHEWVSLHYNVLHLYIHTFVSLRSMVSRECEIHISKIIFMLSVLRLSPGIFQSAEPILTNDTLKDRKGSCASF